MCVGSPKHLILVVFCQCEPGKGESQGNCRNSFIIDGNVGKREHAQNWYM